MADHVAVVEDRVWTLIGVKNRVVVVDHILNTTLAGQTFLITAKVVVLGNISRAPTSIVMEL